jgi:hypothetical protein
MGWIRRMNTIPRHEGSEERGHEEGPMKASSSKVHKKSTTEPWRDNMTFCSHAMNETDQLKRKGQGNKHYQIPT